jgi:hypothetical protein
MAQGDMTINGGDLFGAANLNLWSALFLQNPFMYTNSSLSLHLDEDNNTAGAGFYIMNGTNTVVYLVDESGNTTATGTKSAIVDTVSHGTRLLYAVESTEVWFEHAGRGQLVNGEVVITFDPVFAETVNLNENYEVFLTPIGDWADLYVAEMTATSFTIRAADGDSNIEFSYRIMAKRLGYEEDYIEEVTP